MFTLRLFNNRMLFPKAVFSLWVVMFGALRLSLGAVVGPIAIPCGDCANCNMDKDGIVGLPNNTSRRLVVLCYLSACNAQAGQSALSLKF